MTHGDFRRQIQFFLVASFKNKVDKVKEQE
jgi:hypothetical protein